MLPKDWPNLNYKYYPNTGKGAVQELFEDLEPDVYKLQYKIGNDGDWAPNDIPKMNDAKDYNITFYFSDNELYNDFDKVVNVKIDKADIKIFKVIR